MTERATTGVPGLDLILGGGFPRDHVFLLEGRPGSGKTTLSLQYLLEGVRLGEPAMYVTHSESEREVRDVAKSHGWSLDGVHVHEWQYGPGSTGSSTIFHASEVELGESMARFLQEVDRLKPRRLVFDSIVGLRLLAGDESVYRRQIQVLRRHFDDRRCTVLLIDDSPEGDQRAQTIVHGVVQLQNLPQTFGPERRQARVLKLRGTRYVGGYHDFVIQTGGIVVYPRLVALDHDGANPEHRELGSGVPELDTLLGGGLTTGSSTLLIGPAGVGKSTIAAHYALQVAKGGESAWVMMFDEVEQVWRKRVTGLGLEVDEHLRSGKLRLSRVDPASVSPGWLSDSLVRAVKSGLKLFVLDSLNGYLQAMAEERHVEMHLRELLTFLDNSGVVTILTLSQHGVVGHMATPVDVSFLADTVLLLRYFEHSGTVRQAISVVKKRTGSHERTIRELRLGNGGVQLGEALSGFHGVLTGVPDYRGGAEKLLTAKSA